MLPGLPAPIALSFGGGANGVYAAVNRIEGWPRVPCYAPNNRLGGTPTNTGFGDPPSGLV